MRIWVLKFEMKNILNPNLRIRLTNKMWFWDKCQECPSSTKNMEVFKKHGYEKYI